MTNELKKRLDSLRRINSTPEYVQKLSKSIYDILSEGEASRNKRNDELRHLQTQVGDLKVILENKSQSTLREVVQGVLKMCTKDFLESIPKESLLNSMPFREIGNLPVCEDEKTASSQFVSRLRDFCHAFEWSNEIKFPVIPESEKMKAGTITPYRGSGTYYCFFIIYRWASTRVEATGVDACPTLGGQYASALDLCTHVRNLSPTTPDYALWALIGGAACLYAQEAPKVNYVVYKLKVCVGTNSANLEASCTHCNEKMYTHYLKTSEIVSGFGDELVTAGVHTVQLTENAHPQIYYSHGGWYN